MLFTPPTTLTEEPVSSSVGNDSPILPVSSASYPPSESGTEYSETRPRAVSTSYNATLITNGPPNNRSLSTSQSRFSQLPDQDWFYSASPASASRLSVHHLAPTTTKISDTQTSSTNRRVSCPVPRNNNNKKENRFRFPSIISSTIRDALMAHTPTTNTNDITHHSRASITGSKRPSSIFLPVANPVAAAALIEDDESEPVDEQTARSVTPSPLDSPKSSAHFHRTPTECSTSNSASHSYNNKAILNVGGVRHEGNFFFSSSFHNYMYIN